MKKITLLGNLGKDAVIHETNGYTAIQLNMATTEKHKDSTGVYGDLTTWSNCTYWGKKEHLEKLLPNLKKGKKIFVEGTFNVTIYNDKPQIQVVVNTLQLC